MNKPLPPQVTVIDCTGVAAEASGGSATYMLRSDRMLQIKTEARR